MDEERLFHLALEKPAAERAAFLDEACAGDAALRGRVEVLLQAHENPGSFLGSPAASPGAGALNPDQRETLQGPDLSGTEAALPRAMPHGSAAYDSGSCIGPYRLLQAIGEGGMGTVWKAEQIAPVRRTVALKVIKPGLDTRQVLSRFEAERQALALMDHPNIAKVLDAGSTDQSRPYFVMELVEGTPITRYCDQQRLTPRQRLELAIPVCHAIQHAHQKGIIHRDIKPSNVLVIVVDGKPVPKVIDFGIAKATAQRLTEETLLTELGVVVGTPEYMSPEQAELNNGDIDTRSDIYCLGVLLYELLTGTTPLQHLRVHGAALLEVLRLVREEEPQKPSTRLSSTDELPSIAAVRNTEPRRLTGLVRGDLDWIVMKALEKDRARRYETVNGLARDIQRFLADEPVEARPPSKVYRLRKFVRRHRRSLVTSALVVVPVLALGSAGYLWTESQRANRIEATTRSVSAALDEAQRLRGEAQAGPAGEINKWNESLSAVRRAEGLMEQGEADAVLRGRVTAALAQISEQQAKVEERARQLAIDRTLLSELETIRGSHAEHWDPKRTDAEYAAAFHRAGLDIDKVDPVEAGRWIAGRSQTVELTAFLDDWSMIRNSKAFTEASFRRLIATARNADPDAWRNELRPLMRLKADEWSVVLRRIADDETIREQPVSSLLLLGTLLKKLGDTERAERVWRLAVQRDPGDFWAHYFLSFCWERLENGTRRFARSGNPSDMFTRPEEAVRHLTAAVAIRPRSSIAHRALGNALVAHGRPEEALIEFKEEIQLSPGTASGHVGLGNIRYVLDRLDEAVAEYREAIRIDPNGGELYKARLGLGSALYEQGNLEEAVTEFRALIRLKSDFAPAHSMLGRALAAQDQLDEAKREVEKAIELDRGDASFHQSLGIVLGKQGKHDEAIGEYEEAIRLDPEHIRAYSSLGAALCDVKHDFPAAEAAFRKGISHMPRRPDGSFIPSYKLAEFHYNLGNALFHQGKLGDAIVEFQESIRLRPDLAEAHYNLGKALQAQGKLDLAIARYEETIRLKPDYAYAHSAFGIVLCEQGKLDAAIVACREAIRLKPDYAEAHNNLGIVFYKQGKLDEAIAKYHDAIRLKPDYAIPHNNLGNVFYKQGKLDEAIAKYEEAIRLKPDYAIPHYNLGKALLQQGDFIGAITSLRKACEPVGPEPERHFPGISDNLVQAERMAALKERLPALLRGEDKPWDAPEGLSFAMMAYQSKRYTAAARLFREALETDPKLADDRRTQHAYNAACAAALAASAPTHGEEESLDDPTKTSLRQQALDWLKAELTAWTMVIESANPQSKESVTQALQRWQRDPDLAGVRDEAALAELPEAERKAWQALWAEVELLIGRAKGPG